MNGATGSAPAPSPALQFIDVAGMRGLEIGPLASPRVKKSDGSVFYVDHCTTEELRASYAANSLMRPHLDEIVEVDYVVRDGSSISATVGADGPFDYVIASHVLEHLADPIGWLEDVRHVLAPDGLVSLVVPDKRFSFDINRSLTRPSDWVDWYMRGLEAPSFGQLFDFFSGVTTIDGTVDILGLWAGTADYTGVRRGDVPDPDASAFAVCLQYKEVPSYIDVHTGVYTPGSLLSLLGLAVRLDVARFEVAYFAPTGRDSLEFHMTLRACPDRERALASVVAARELLAQAPEPTPARVGPVAPEVVAGGPAGVPLQAGNGEMAGGAGAAQAGAGDGAGEAGAGQTGAGEAGAGLTGTGGGAMEVSRLEREMVLLKRSVLGWARRVLARL